MAKLKAESSPDSSTFDLARTYVVPDDEVDIGLRAFFKPPSSLCVCVFELAVLSITVPFPGGGTTSNAFNAVLGPRLRPSSLASRVPETTLVMEQANIESELRLSHSMNPCWTQVPNWLVRILVEDNGDFSHVGFAIREGLYAHTAFHVGLVQTLQGVAVRPGRYFVASCDGSRRREIDFSTAIFEKVAQNGPTPLRSCSGYDLCAIRLSSPDWCALGCKSISQATLTVSGMGKGTIFSTPKVLEGEIFGTSSTGTIGSMAEPLNAVPGLEPHTVSTSKGDSGSPLLVMVHGHWRIVGIHLCSSPWRFKVLGEVRYLPENYAATISALDRIRVLCGEHSFIDDSVVEMEESDFVPFPLYYCEANTDETHSASKPKRQHKHTNIDGGK